MLTALLGIETYAVREGARIRNDKHRIDKFVSEVFSINIMSLIISYIFLLFFIFTNQKIYSYKELILILSIMIPCTVLGRDYINIIYVIGKNAFCSLLIYSGPYIMHEPCNIQSNTVGCFVLIGILFVFL